MQEGQVTLSGAALPLPEYFTVMATMNPYDGVGTYTLPLATYDRFGYSYEFEYPSIEKESAILSGAYTDYPSEPVIKRADIGALRKKVLTIHVEDKITTYVATLLASLRVSDDLASGVSVRAGLAIIAGARARALLRGRDFVLPEDIEALWIPTLRHRLELSYTAESRGVTRASILMETLERNPTPDASA